VRVVHDWAFYDALETEHKDFEKFCRYEQYIERLRTCDISLLPLRDTRFNRCKSDLKFIESAAHGAVALAGPTVYAKSIREGETGLIFDSPREFEVKLNRLIDDHKLRVSIIENAYTYVSKERMLSQHYRERYDWYCDLRDRLPDLNQELRLRVPAMFSR
jgi:glycosyltransferase involved in cell wall biosynthesis